MVVTNQQTAVNSTSAPTRPGAWRLGVAAVALLTALYSVAFVRLFPLVGDAAGALFLIPVAAAAWFFAVRGGLVLGLLGIPLNLGLSIATQTPPNIVALVAGVAIGVLFGVGRSVIDKTDRQAEEILAQRRAQGSLDANAEIAARSRARQLGIIATLGRTAVLTPRSDDVMKAAARAAADGLETDFADVLEYVPGSEKFVFKAIHGAGEDLLGRTLGAGKGSHSGLTFILRAPVIVEDYATDSRFQIPVASKQYRLVSGASVVIESAMGRPWGTLSVYTKMPRIFSDEDVAFLQSISNVIASTIEARNAEEARAKLASLSSVGVLAVGAADEIVAALSPDGSLPRAMDAARRIRRAAANLPGVEDGDRVVEEALSIAFLRAPDANITATLDCGRGTAVSSGELAQLVLDLIGSAGGHVMLRTSSVDGAYCLEVSSSSIAVPASVRVAENRGAKLSVVTEGARTTVRVVLPTIVQSSQETAGGPAVR